jgi:radical S-adenosyl methionine domain-containing protein 2
VFDIGSGSIKCEVARVSYLNNNTTTNNYSNHGKGRSILQSKHTATPNAASNQVEEILYSKDITVLFLKDLRNSKNIQPATAQRGVQALNELISATDSFNVTRSLGVATEAFRKAANGQDIISHFSNETTIPIRIVSQEEEARFGYNSATALCSSLSRNDEEKLIAWDCGAGSTQMTSVMKSHIDSHGSGTVLKQALQLRRTNEGVVSSANPFNQSQLDQLLDSLHKSLKPFPRWLLSGQRNFFVGIGSKQSIFNQQAVLGGNTRFNIAAVQASLDQLVGLDDSEIFQFEQARHSLVNERIPYVVQSGNAAYVVPKLALLFSVMRKCEIDQVDYKLTNGNCSALLGDGNLWRHTRATPNVETKGHMIRLTTKEKSQDVVSAEVKLDWGVENKERLLTVNWHLEKDCNYKCSFCYATFADTKQNISKEKGFKLLKSLSEAGIFKVNFAGGEPLLNNNLGEYLKYCKALGMKTSIITNASIMTKPWLWQHAKYIDQIGVSCDSLDDNVNKELGRGFGQHVQITSRALRRIEEVCVEQNLKINVKLNTVVMRQNHMEDFSDFILEHGVKRWKVFKILRIEGENDKAYDDLSLSDAQFDGFVERHTSLTHKGVVMAPESNDDMTSSYLMITPDGKFYQNTEGKYKYSDAILDSGVLPALGEVGFDYSKFQKRGGEYML